MAPKRRAAAASKAGGKKVKKEEPEPVPVKDAFQAAKDSLKSAAPQVKGSRKPDAHCDWPDAVVHEDYDCMLNQTNIGHNNNKFYVIQVLTSGTKHYCWTRWGRVGEVGASKGTGPNSLDSVIKEFEKKFKDKTKNNWSDRANFVTHPGKYTLIEVDGDEDAEVKVDTVDAPSKPKVESNILPCTLDGSTQKLIDLIFSKQMFQEAMEAMNLDIKKMPLGKLSKSQIAKGFEVIEELEAAVKTRANRSRLEELSSRFFTIIPHNFGRNRPPVIDDSEIIEKKKEMLLVLADIEVAQSLQAEAAKPKEVEMVPHPLDKDYQSLKCDLSLVGTDTEEFQVIQKYLSATQAGRKLKLLDVWKVDREAEAERFKAHDHLDNRRLLWHGTNVAVVAAILKGGLRIMPHSGGRVGKGIYFASENSKSASYVSTCHGFGLMFLNEVALGKEHTITQDNSSLRQPPAGFDSVVARGQQEPDPSKDITITMDGKTVTVPHGAAKKQPKYKDSYFDQSEYLIYKESQCRIRYLLKLKF